MATARIWTYGGGVRPDVELNGFDVEARDGEIGTVDESSREVGSSYLIVDTGPWIFGKRVLLPAGVIEKIDRGNRRIFVNRTRDEIKRAPEYDPYAGISPAFYQRVGTYYGSTGMPREEEMRRGTQAQARASRSRSSTSSSRSRTSSSSRSRSTSSRSRSRTQAKSSASRSRTTRGRSSRRQSEGPTKEELYAQAKRLNVEGRSKMNKTQLARAVAGKRGSSARRSTSQRGQTRASSTRSRTSSSRTRRAKANPVEVQRFLDGVSYPTRKGELLREAERSGARREVRSTLERLPEERFSSPTEVSEAIGKLR